MRDIIKQFLPRTIKSIIKKVYYSSVDTIDLLLGRRDELTPPRRMIFVGNGDFKKIGEEFVRYLIDLGGLGPDERVLDVGCGIGRMAVPLTKYLNNLSSYEGFDIVIDGINWCRKKISSRYPNFHFQLADVFNKYYNQNGKYKASEYKFPYDNEYFDFVFLTSVFTHLLSNDMENYFNEIARVLKKDGRCLITFFLLNKKSLQLMSEKKSSLNFNYDTEIYSTIDKIIPETAIAYNEKFIRRLYEKYRMNIIEPIHYGSWCGRESFLSYQDIIIAVKKENLNY